MSWWALIWAGRQRAGRAKAVLWPLAHLANKHDCCWPSIAYLADVCELGESTVRRMIQELAARKVLTIERRFGDNGGCRSNMYRLAIDSSLRLTGDSPAAIGGTVSPVTGRRYQGDGLTTTRTVMYEQPLQVGVDESDEEPTCRTEGGSGDFYFPKGMSDAQRQELAVHLRELSHEQSQNVLDEIAGRMAMTEVRNPVGYGATLVKRAKLGTFQRQVGLKIAERRAADQRHRARLRDSRTAAHLSANDSLARLPKELREPLEAIRASVTVRSAGDSEDDLAD